MGTFFWVLIPFWVAILGIMHSCNWAEIASTSLMRVVNSHVIENKFRFLYWPCQWAFRKIEITICGNIPCCWEHFTVKTTSTLSYISLPSKYVYTTHLWPKLSKGDLDQCLLPAVNIEKSSRLYLFSPWGPPSGISCNSAF